MTIIGNLGNEPEMRYTPAGRPVTSFRVATNWRYTTSEGERKEETEWFSIVAWNKLAEQCNQFLTKARLVYIEGRLRMHSWEGQDGQTRFRNEIVADRVKFLDRQAAGARPEEKVEEGEQREQRQQREEGEQREERQPGEAAEFGPDDIPF